MSSQTVVFPCGQPHTVTVRSPTPGGPNAGSVDAYSLDVAGCHACAVWTNAFLALLRGQTAGLLEELHRAERRNTDMRDVLRTAQTLAHEFAELFWDSEQKRKRAEEQLKSTQNRCECVWRQQLSRPAPPPITPPPSASTS
ncbi:hypothetical protein C8Q76DRAFT_789197 [Earliella scabrosa]|nr:hypothetical protein C8Q76DRAFT_789197 [Earliella scabrosa]